MATCIDRTGGVARYSDVIYGQHLISKVSSNFASGTGAPLPQSLVSTEQHSSPQKIAERSLASAESRAPQSVAPAVPDLTTNTTIPRDPVDTILKALIQALTPPATSAGLTEDPAVVAEMRREKCPATA